MGVNSYVLKFVYEVPGKAFLITCTFIYIWRLLNFVKYPKSTKSHENYYHVTQAIGTIAFLFVFETGLSVFALEFGSRGDSRCCDRKLGRVILSLLGCLLIFKLT